MMQNLISLFYNNCLRALKYILMLLILLCFLSACFFTTYINDMGTQIMLTGADNLPITLLTLLPTLAMLWWLQKKQLLSTKILLPLTLLWYVIGGSILIIFSRSVPAADPMTVYSIANAFADGNLAAIHPTDSYLSYYPHQIGLIAYYEILLRIWNLLPIHLDGYHLIKLLNVFWACLFIFFQHLILKQLFHKEQINITYLLLMLMNLPLLIYTSFVYGEIPSLTFFHIGVWAILRSMYVLNQPADKKRNKKYLLYTLLSYLCLICCIMLRKNAMILIIAVIGVTFIEALKQKKTMLWINIPVYLLIMLLTLPCVQQFYETRANNHLSSGVTALSYFAMGMQESARGEGWYNGFNFNTYESSGFDTALANRISLESIRERLGYFQENPSQLLRFYKNKFRTQWCDGTYACLQATVNNFGGRSTFFHKLYNGDYDFLLLPFCNLLQNILYLGSLLFIIIQLKNKDTESTFHGFYLYLPMIGVLGGFLFHMIWEANSRYIFPYALMLYPYAAHGISEFPWSLKSFHHKKKDSGKN